ncbi:MAG: hypothetical protein ACKOCK_13225, partial [Chloroflexota bacterium]
MPPKKSRPDAPANGTTTAAKSSAPKRTTKKARAAAPETTLLPVLVVEETLLLPHMSIPFPIEDEDSAMVIYRAERMTQRLVLVLTE